MSPSSTKEKILEAALELFNEHGLANVRLQMIADKTGISVGNLAYHFKNKKAIVQAISSKLYEEFGDILAMYRSRNGLPDLDAQLERLYDFVTGNPYCFFDAKEVRNYFPRETGVVPGNGAEKLLYQLRHRFSAMQETGLLMKEPMTGFFDQEAFSIWMYIIFLIPTSDLLSQPVPPKRAFKRWIWSKFLPFFTDKGKVQFRTLIEPALWPEKN